MKLRKRAKEDEVREWKKGDNVLPMSDLDVNARRVSKRLRLVSRTTLSVLLGMSIILMGARDLWNRTRHLKNYDKGGLWAWLYLKAYGNLDGYQKSGKVFASVSDVLNSGATGFLAGSSGFNTDKNSRHNYSAYYDIVLEPYMHEDVHVLEVGVRKGGSLKLWRELFSPATFIYGIDISTQVPQFPHDAHIKVVFGSTTDDGKRLWDTLSHHRFDVIIDDGDHSGRAQWETFALLGPLLKSTGVYVIEDLFSTGETAHLLFDRCGLDVSVHADPSGEMVAFLYPKRSIAGRTALGIVGEVYPRLPHAPDLESLRLPGSAFKPISTYSKFCV